MGRTPSATGVKPWRGPSRPPSRARGRGRLSGPPSKPEQGGAGQELHVHST
jgi:hypothetical protein